ncbi:YecA family protein [Alicyclobacillus mengziensis]|uniref:SEC-C domain-containing protein n=1 Tax=Alicyclobacillus mengziensis TaxID=2931921 RepID=A0A9X7Z7Q6_9BACL|nr:SEC-C metal-binding domain-containing protein [Alicyclobacillus mengziensis]QSO49354.1 SEC-C domain-containing protein [Alicyclobacillus mengziensis]
MNNEWNSRDKKMLEQAIERAREERRKIEDKEAVKRWREIPYPLDLADALSRLTKNDLSDMRSNLRIRNASTLNKQDLVELLSRQVPKALPGLLLQLDEARYGVLKRIADTGGQAFVSLEPHQYEYFQVRGLAFTGTVGGNRTLVMPKEILEGFRDLDGPSVRSVIRKQTQWLQISQGLLYYYGFLSTNDLVEMVGHFTGDDTDTYHFISVLYEGMDWGYGLHPHVGGFSNEDVLDVQRVIREQQSRPGVPFYPFTKTQLLNAGKPEFVDKNSAYRAFVDFLRRSYQIDLADAEDEADLCVYEIQNGESLGDIIKAITEDFEIPTMEVLQTLTHYVSELHNNTRQWFLKGHTPTELLPNDVAAMRPLPSAKGAPKGEVVRFATKKKVGRNDPCPCGSGKKYKKCCGR